MNDQPTSVLIERGRVRRFAAALGETDLRYFDVEHARRLGHPDLPLPPTFLFTLESENEATLAFTQELGIDPLDVLHGEQSFEHVLPLHACERVELRHHITSDQVREAKQLRFFVRETEVRRHGRLAARLRSTWIVRGATALP